MDKAEVARRQLGTALSLFINDHDPISVHCLACGGGEIAEHLISRTTSPAFAAHIIDTFPDMDIAGVRRLRRQYWNAFKHATSRGAERNDSDLLARFSDEQNDFELFIGWYDFGCAIGRLPVEVQVFQVWFFVLYPDRLREGVDRRSFEGIFPGLRSMARVDQKLRLRQMILKTRSMLDVMADPRTDTRPLMYGA